MVGGHGGPAHSLLVDLSLDPDVDVSSGHEVFVARSGGPVVELLLDPGVGLLDLPGWDVVSPGDLDELHGLDPCDSLSVGQVAIVPSTPGGIVGVFGLWHTGGDDGGHGKEGGE